MKQLIVIRHAKSSWDFTSLNDAERPLNERGHKDAPKMAKHLLKQGIAIDAFISSPAKRAFTTATYFAEAYGKKGKEIIKAPGLYHASEPVVYELLCTLDDTLSSIAIFSHNPGITTFVNGLTDSSIDFMPTCGVFAVKIQSDTWKDIMYSKKEFWFFTAPKML